MGYKAINGNPESENNELESVSRASIKKVSRRDTAVVFPPSTAQPPPASTKGASHMESGPLTNTMESSLTQKVSTRAPLAPNKSASKPSMRVSRSHEDDNNENILF